MLNKLGIASILMLLISNFATAGDKINALKDANKLSEKVIDLFEKQLPLSSLDAINIDDIKHLYSNTNNIYALALHAITCYDYIFLGNAEDQSVDIVLERAWKESINRIVELGGEEGLQTLENLKMMRSYDGDYSLFLKEALLKLGNKSTKDGVYH